MTNLDLLMKQHKEIGEIMMKIEAIKTVPEVKEKSFDLAMSIALLSGKLLMHLNSEDKFLYPNLSNHPSRQVQQLAGTFAKEMGSLANTFSNYKQIYMLSQNIKDNPSQFLNDTKVIFLAIKKRMTAEEKELYPLLH